VTRRRILKKRLRRLFPGLRSTRFTISSKQTWQYNCVAWAAGQTDRWWEPTPGYYWPATVPCTESVDSAIKVVEILGYSACLSPALEPGYEKVAIYADAAGYTHVARQLDGGEWTSKLGGLEDVQHASLSDLAGTDYGQPARVLRRARTPLSTE
jgi:hypothetical protein